MRWLSTLAVATLAVPAYAGDNDAEQLFRKMTQKIQSAKAVQVRFEAKTFANGMELAGGFTGSLHFGEGDKWRFEIVVTTVDKEKGGDA
jgi:hypothetical protein